MSSTGNTSITIILLGAYDTTQQANKGNDFGNVYLSFGNTQRYQSWTVSQIQKKIKDFQLRCYRDILILLRVKQKKNTDSQKIFTLKPFQVKVYC